MDLGLPRKGLDATEKLYEQYNTLLSVLGKGNLLFKNDVTDPSSVPESCEHVNKTVSTLLTAIRNTLYEIRQSYEFSQREMEQHKDRLPQFDNLEISIKMDVDCSPEYQHLHQLLQKKNGELKDVIDEVQKIFADINQLSSF